MCRPHICPSVCQTPEKRSHNGYTNLPDVVQPSHSPTDSTSHSSPGKDSAYDVSQPSGASSSHSLSLSPSPEDFVSHSFIFVSTVVCIISVVLRCGGAVVSVTAVGG